ncbi:hypothetical protein ACFX13_018893 [Malus domestica]|uniref:putative B3 domain-containing protein Os03g0621600 n=1 Tax=Malus domestica TaxID=3750 RepID=UPI003975AE6A
MLNTHQTKDGSESLTISPFRGEALKRKKKMVMARSNAVRAPTFFKVLVDDFSTQLQIPLAFLVHFDGKVPQETHLQTPGGTWPVSLEKRNDRFFFQKGWKEFVQDNGFQLCEFLVFRYYEKLGFYVDIYGRNGCKKEFVMVIRKRDRPHEEAHGNAVHRKTPRNHGKQNVDNQGQKGLAYGTGTSHATHANIQIKDEVTDDREYELSMHPRATRTEKAVALQKGNDFEYRNPFFKVPLRFSYTHYGYLALPVMFVKAHLTVRPSDATLRVSDGTTWPVKVGFDVAGHCRFLSGWRLFVNDNGLEIGDICVFVLINKIKFLFEVVLHRKIGAVSPTLSPVEDKLQRRINSSYEIKIEV